MHGMAHGMGGHGLALLVLGLLVLAGVVWLLVVLSAGTSHPKAKRKRAPKAKRTLTRRSSTHRAVADDDDDEWTDLDYIMAMDVLDDFD